MFESALIQAHQYLRYQLITHAIAAGGSAVHTFRIAEFVTASLVCSGAAAAAATAATLAPERASSETRDWATGSRLAALHGTWTRQSAAKLTGLQPNAEQGSMALCTSITSGRVVRSKERLTSAGGLRFVVRLQPSLFGFGCTQLCLHLVEEHCLLQGHARHFQILRQSDVTHPPYFVIFKSELYC